MHFTTPEFWQCYNALPEHVRRSADNSYALLRQNPRHPSLHFKRIGRFWAVRAGANHRALGIPIEAGILWFWIGSHAEYERQIASA